MSARLYFAGQLVAEYESSSPSMSQYLHSNWGLEIYNGGYICVDPITRKKEWFRCDYTPVLPQDVPKDLLLLELLLH